MEAIWGKIFEFRLHVSHALLLLPLVFYDLLCPPSERPLTAPTTFTLIRNIESLTFLHRSQRKGISPGPANPSTHDARTLSICFPVGPIADAILKGMIIVRILGIGSVSRLLWSTLVAHYPILRRRVLGWLTRIANLCSGLLTRLTR